MLRWAFGIMAIASVAVAAPFAPWVIVASWIATMLRPSLLWLERKLHGRTRAAALLTVALAIGIVGPIVVVGVLLGVDAIALARRLYASQSGHEALAMLVSGDGEAPLSLDYASVVQFFREQGDRAIAMIGGVAGTTLDVALGLFVFFTAAYVLLAEGNTGRAFLHRSSPLSEEHTTRLIDAFHETGRALFVGIGLTALVQAVLATITYAALGVPRAAVLGIATFVAAFLPTVGTFLIWAPVSLGLALTGRTTEAIVLAAIGALVISTIDNLLRPTLARRAKLELHSFVVLVSMLGGLVLIGPWGLILGPLVVRMTVELARIVREEGILG